jgi:hypothetical protein
MGFMESPLGNSLLRVGDSRWEQINREQDAADDARARALSVVERLDRGLRLSRSAAELRRAAWEAQHGHHAT